MGPGNSRLTIGPSARNSQYIGPAPVMGPGPMGAPCMGGGCAGMTSVPVGANMVHNVHVTNVPGVPKAEVAVATPGQPTIRQGKMSRTKGDVVLPPVVPNEGGAKELGLVDNGDGTHKLVVPQINGHVVPIPGVAGAIDPSAV